MHHSTPLPDPCRLIFVTNHLPLKVHKDEVSGWSFEWDEDSLVLQAREGLLDDMEAVYVGCLPVEIEGHEQEVCRDACFVTSGVWLLYTVAAAWRLAAAAVAASALSATAVVAAICDGACRPAAGAAWLGCRR